MLTIAIVWCLIGALFGMPRARARYRNEIEVARKLGETVDRGTVSGAVFEAVIEQIKWTLLGVLSAVSYIAWFFLELALANEKELKKPNALGAIGFSVLVFALGVLALEKRESQ